MSRFFMTLSYRGAPFHGWQVQPGAVSVQGVLEDALATLLRTPTPVTGAGRTDAGVNASMMVAHFDADLTEGYKTGGGGALASALQLSPAEAITLGAEAPSPPQLHASPAEAGRLRPQCSASALVRGLNSLVGKDIAIHSIRQVHADAHARFDAIERTYHYKAVEHKSPFLYPLTWYTRPLDYDAMNEAARLLLTTEDFTSFAKLHSDAKTNICHVTRAEWVPDPTTGGMTFIISANRFLRNMVRAVVGTLVDVGRGKLTADDFAAIIAAKDRCAAGTSMPPEALYLADIKYPYPL